MPLAILEDDYRKSDEVMNTNGLPMLAYGIAKAIAEERERCAKIAESFNDAGKPIALAIRGLR